jgi:site-specific recombinase XerD
MRSGAADQNCETGFERGQLGSGTVTWHMFRHTFASRLPREGVDIVTVKELLGHSNISTTMRYAHSNDEAKRRGGAVLEE